MGTVAIREEKPETEVYAPDCSKPKDHDEADLCVQRDMARAADKAVKWARTQTWIGGVGLFFVLLTLIANAGATIAAVCAGRGADKTARRQLRAYVGHWQCRFEDRPVAGGMAVQGGSVKYFEINSGRTPALDTKMFVNIVPFDPKNVAPRPDDANCRQIPLVQIVHPNQNFGAIVGPQTKSDTFLLHGYVTYEDIFKGRWKRRFAFVHNASHDPGVTERWVAYPTHNDEEEIKPPTWLNRFKHCWHSSSSK